MHSADVEGDSAAATALREIVVPHISKVVDEACGEEDTAWLMTMQGIVLTITSLTTYYNDDGTPSTIQFICKPVAPKQADASEQAGTLGQTG